MVARRLQATRALRQPPTLPPRYDGWYDSFWAHVRCNMRPGVRVLDVGSGPRPTIDPRDRPPGCHYVALDVSATELAAAPPGTYDETVISDIATPPDRLAGSFDLILTWQVLEHVRPLAQAFGALREYLRPGGVLIAFFSGRFAAHAVANLATWRASPRLVSWLTHREASTIFPAYYDGCYATALERMLSDWSTVRIEPQWGAGVYFVRVPVVQRAYLKYEDWTCRARLRNLATHYLVVARR